MPLYEYRCQNCGHKFELLRGFSQADEPATCPACGQSNGQRLLSLFACLSKDASGTTSAIPGTGSACSTCAATSCAGCKR